MHYATHMFMSSGFGQFALWPKEGTPKTGVKDLFRQSCICLILRFAILIIFVHWSMGGVVLVKPLAKVDNLTTHSMHLYVMVTLEFSVLKKQ